MRKVLLTVALVIATTAIFAQSPIAKGQAQFNAGVGFSTWGVPLYVGFDYGIHKDITLGIESSYRSYRERWHDQRYHHSVIGFLGNINYHFNSIFGIPPVWDFYAGLNLGFYIWNADEKYLGSHASGLGLGAQVGGRYYFTDRVGINLEFGGGNAFSSGKIGISLKI